MSYIDRSDRALAEIRDHLQGVPADMAEVGAREIVGVMERGSPSGEKYWDSELRRQYEASAPGEPPAIRTSEYADAYGSTEAIERGSRSVAAVTNDRMVGEEGFPIPLWLILEYGTRFVAPRPHVRQGAVRAAEQIRRGAARVSA